MAQGTLRSVTAVAAVLVCGQSLQSAETIAEVPFELYQRHLVVTKGSIGPLNGLDLLIDTGTIPSVVDRRIARKLRLQTEPSRLVAFGQQAAIQSATIDGFKIGSLQSGPVPAAVGDLSYLEGVGIDAIVGLDVLARRNFSIDYRTHMLSFAPGGQDKSVAPLELAWPFLTARMTVGGQQVRLLVDTGSADLVLFKARMPAALSNPPWKGDKTVQYAAGAARLLKLELRQAALGPDTWDKLPAWSLDRETAGYPPGIDGVLGVTALGCQRVRFDFEKGEFGWTR
jgi:predicted aspartyl protease